MAHAEAVVTMRRLAFIPAREHSRRLSGKNLAAVGGKSLVRRAVEIAIEARALGVVDDVVTSVEDWETREEAQRAGATAVSRATHLRAPETTVLDVLKAHLADAPEIDLVCLLLPTSPLRTLRHIVESRLLLRERVDAVMSVTPFRQDVDYALHVVDDGMIVRHEACCPHGAAWEDHRYWKHDGHVLWGRTAWLSKARNLYDGRLVPYAIPPDASSDIDTALDLAWCDFLLARGARAHD